MDIGREMHFQGYWWLPSAPEVRIPGELRCSRDGKVELFLFGSFNEIPTMPQMTGKRFDIILGMNDRGKPITLVYNRLIHWQINQGVPRQKYYASFLMVGEHFTDLEDLQFNAATFRIYGLDEWVGVSGFHIDIDLPHNKFLVKFELPEYREYSIDQKRRISVRFGWRAPLHSPMRAVSIEQAAYLRLEYVQPQTLDTLLADVNKVKNLISLCIGKPLALTEISLALPSTDTDDQTTSSVDLYYQSLPAPEDSFQAYPSQMLLGFPVISSSFGDLLHKWFDLYEEIPPTVSLFFAVQHQKDLYLEHQFLSLVQALETLHRRTISNQLDPEEVHQRRLERIFGALTSEDKNWLKPKLQYSNEPSLRQRLKELLEPFSHLLFKNHKECKRFVNTVVKTRNYLVHYDENLQKQVAQGKHLLDLIRQLKLLTVLHVFHLLGLKEEEFYRSVSRYFQV